MNSSDRFADAIARALREAPPMPLDEETVRAAIDSRVERAARAEAQFRIAFERGLAAVPRTERDGGLNGATGHIAESVTEVLLVDLGWTPQNDFAGPLSGGHGIDLAMLAPDVESLFAIEVKGTLQTSRWPRLRRGELSQLTPGWIGKADNPGVSELDIDPTGMPVLAVLIQFGRRSWKVAWSVDGETAHPVVDADDLADLTAG